MTTYLAMIYTPEMDWDQSKPAEMSGEYAEFNKAAAAVLRGGNALYPSTTATTVRVSGGKGGDVLTTDGPYAETKEQLGGFWVIDAPDLDAALAWAAKATVACRGAIELRPFQDEPEA
jgi:hypothetical protein